MYVVRWQGRDQTNLTVDIFNRIRKISFLKTIWIIKYLKKNTKYLQTETDFQVSAGVKL